VFVSSLHSASVDQGLVDDDSSARFDGWDSMKLPRMSRRYSLYWVTRFKKSLVDDLQYKAGKCPRDRKDSFQLRWLPVGYMIATMSPELW
jgi:hypothetical protein